MNYKKHTLLLVSAVVLLSAGVVGVAMAQSVVFDKDIDLQGTKKVLNAMNIGIGTASPQSLLHVSSSSLPTIILQSTGNTGGNIDFWAYNRSYVTSRITGNEGGAVGRGFISFNNRNDAGSMVEAMRIDGQNGNIAIGTTSVGSRLTVSPVSSISADMLSGRIQNLASPLNTADAATKNYVDTVAAGGTLWTLGATEMNVYTTNSRGVGIGTATPLHKLDIIGSYYSRTVVKGTCSSTVAIDWTLGNTQHCVLGSTPVTFTFSGGQSGGNYKLILKQDGTGSRTVNWPSASIRWGSGSAPYLTPTPLKTDYIGFIYNGIDGYYDNVAFNANF